MVLLFYLAAKTIFLCAFQKSQGLHQCGGRSGSLTMKREAYISSVNITSITGGAGEEKEREKWEEEEEEEED